MLELRKLKFLPMLETLVVLENPFTLDVEEEYRVEILVHLPNLKRIDKGPVQRDETEEAKVRREELGSEDENEGEEEVGEEASPEEEGDNDDD
ncbi:leucine-rich repeat-containing protein 23-like [Periplaneta americana]|uniref:leucine-rich repeat-containing protein 23-like n=1 Tax=Periplaneta americana TaxID=6978 RepID=UPI0037E7619C